MLVSELIDKVYNEWLYPAGIDRPTFDVLSGAIDDTTTNIILEGRIGRVPPDGTVEIEDELILVKSTSGSTITAQERGYANTDPAAHADGTKVVLDPKYPRKTVLSALAAVVKLLYPWGVYRRVIDTTVVADSSDAFALPAGTLNVIRARFQAIAGRELWPKLYEGEDYDVLHEFSPPKMWLYRGAPDGAPLQLVLAKDFVSALTPAQDLTVDGGIPDTLVEQLPMAIAGWILQSREIPRVQIDEVRRLLSTQGVQVGSALNVGQAMLNHFRTTAILAEKRRLNDLDPPSVVWARR